MNEDVAIWTPGTADMRPARCPVCGSVGAARLMPEHIYKRHLRALLDERIDGLRLNYGEAMIAFLLSLPDEVLDSEFCSEVVNTAADEGMQLDEYTRGWIVANVHENERVKAAHG